jgi:hypothetical protein
MAYRSDVDALEARFQALEADLAERTLERDEAARMLAEARTRAMHEAELADLAAGGPARRRRQRTLIAGMVTVAAMVIGAVGYQRARPRLRDGMEAVILRFSQLSDEMCACRDRGCAIAVTDEMTRWAQDQASRIGPPGSIDKRFTERATEIARRFASCGQRAMRADPDVPSVQ